MPNDAATYLVAVGPHKETTADTLWKDDTLRSHSLSHKGDEKEMQYWQQHGKQTMNKMKGNENVPQDKGLSRRTGINGRSPPTTTLGFLPSSPR